MMEYGKLVNGQIEVFKTPYSHNSRVYYSPTEAEILGFGYKQIVYVMAGNRKWYYAVSHFEEENDSIVQKWEYAKQSEPNWAEMVASYVRERYTLDAEIALLCRGMATADFTAHEQYVAECKERVRLERIEFENA